jgi:hypothetical protein
MTAREPDRHCRVCGRGQASPPWGDDGATPSFEICDRCGTEFGYEDATPLGVARKREEWLSQAPEECRDSPG